jgi:hypothetical protein
MGYTADQDPSTATPQVMVMKMLSVNNAESKIWVTPQMTHTGLFMIFPGMTIKAALFDVDANKWPAVKNIDSGTHQFTSKLSLYVHGRTDPGVTL